MGIFLYKYYQTDGMRNTDGNKRKEEQAGKYQEWDGS